MRKEREQIVNGAVSVAMIPLIIEQNTHILQLMIIPHDEAMTIDAMILLLTTPNRSQTCEIMSEKLIANFLQDVLIIVILIERDTRILRMIIILYDVVTTPEVMIILLDTTLIPEVMTILLLADNSILMCEIVIKEPNANTVPNVTIIVIIIERNTHIHLHDIERLSICC